jgi:hypothetical protein
MEKKKNQSTIVTSFFCQWLTFQNDHVAKWNIEDKNDPYEYKM